MSTNAANQKRAGEFQWAAKTVPKPVRQYVAYDSFACNSFPATRILHIRKFHRLHRCDAAHHLLHIERRRWLIALRQTFDLQALAVVQDALGQLRLDRSVTTLAEAAPSPSPVTKLASALRRMPNSRGNACSIIALRSNTVLSHIHEAGQYSYSAGRTETGHAVHLAAKQRKRVRRCCCGRRNGRQDCPDPNDRCCRAIQCELCANKPASDSATQRGLFRVGAAFKRSHKE